MRVLILTDSVGLPRDYEVGVVQLEDIYVNRLKVSFSGANFVHVGIGGATISELTKQTNYYKHISFDLVLLQCGIVDCAPRSLSVLELELVKRLKLFRGVKPFFRLFRKYRGITYVTSEEFEKHLRELSDRFKGVPIWSIGILPGCDEYEKICPGILKNIDTYNDILRACTNLFVDMSDIPRECVLPDFHHMNSEGHLYLFEKLSYLLRSSL